MPSYDEYYREPHYFGRPYPELTAFFESYEPKGNVLDLGCGQGRDALALGHLNYTVTGVDISEVGLAQLDQAARQEELAIKCIKGDLYNYPISGQFDIVLLDSILHFYKNDMKRKRRSFCGLPPN